MRVHDLKTWPPYFRAILDGRKPFEVRRDDRAFDEGDELRLIEFDPTPLPYTYAGKATGAELRARVTYVMRGGQFGIASGFCVLGIEVLPPYPAAA